ncbi:hypothetical protein [Bosea sp. 124]|uniref:hypothetical protein n=1 Tax=Bosea sp. 124 TaxID=2135642 RepID=UPI000D3FFD1B|nr:hypothetical protein [Bosea sp. 124]PTM41734.1 hypothetical protein C8D03_3307 [Bosea sp. 124]
MSDLNVSAKKAWTPPALDQLTIDATLGGAVTNVFEQVLQQNGTTLSDPGVGSIPGAQTL